MDKKLVLLIAFLPAAVAAANTCTSLSAGNLDVAARWSNCGGTYPQNGDSTIVNHAITQNVPDLILGGSGAPVYGYVDSVSAVSAGSGYTNGCAGGTISGGAATECAVVNGQAVLYLKHRGTYSDATGLTISAITSTNATIRNDKTVRGAATTLVFQGPPSFWAVGSQQQVVISGVTGAWAAMNAAWTATVTASDSAFLYFTIPFDSSALTGTPTGTITVAPGVTASYTFRTVAGGGTAAATMSANGSLTFAANTKLRGDVTFDGAYGVNTNVLVINPGVTVTVDSTQAAGQPIYRILGTNTTQSYRTIYAHCSGNPCRLEAQGGVTGIQAFSVGPRLDIDSLTFYRVGDASTPAIYGAMTSSNSRYSIINSTFDTCGRIFSGAIAVNPSEQVHHDHNRHINSPVGPIPWRNWNFMVSFGGSGGVTTPGDWTIRGNVFDLALGADNPTSSGIRARDVLVEDNYFGGGLSFASDKTASFARNYWQMWGGVFGPGDAINDYFHLDVDWIRNPHWFSLPTGGAIYANSVFGLSGTNPGDSGEVIQVQNSAGTYGAVGSIFLCDASGVGSSEIASTSGSWPLALWRFEHNTFCGGYLGFSPVQINETGNTTAGSITYRSNIIWSAAPSGYLKMNNVGSPGTTDVCTTTSATDSNCDYNAGWNINTGSTPPKGYGGAWSYTPGFHDVDGQDPQFMDRTRKLENWDRNYLGPNGLIPAGEATPAAWTAGAYSQGAIVSHAHASIYSGEMLNFRCRGASCTMEPGVPGTAWRDEWEWAAQYQLRQLVGAQRTITDESIGCSGCYAVAAMVAWVRSGFAPRNPALHGTDPERGDIGAVAWTQGLSAVPVITHASVPVVPVQTSYQFTADRPVRWSLAPGSAGSIDAETGVYTAPSSISVKSKAGACQAWANDHILTTRIDDPGLVHPSAATWAATVHAPLTMRLGNIEDNFSTNITTSAHPSATQSYRYTPLHNGVMFEPSWPDDEIQGGALADPHGGGDRHVFWVARDTCEFQEIYAPGYYHPEGIPGSYPANTWTAGSGLKFSLADSYTLPQLGTNAAGIPFIPALLRLSDFDTGEIRHALGVTFSNGYFHTQVWTWPATAGTSAGPNDPAYPPYGTRFRLKASYDISGFSPYAQMILTAFKRYGVYFSDGGTNFSVTVDQEVRQHPDIWAALQEIRTSGPQWAEHFEAVANEPLKIDNGIGLVRTGTNYPVDDYVEVIATDPVSGLSASRRVILQGIVVGVEHQAITVQGGATKPLPAWVSGTPNQSVTWTVPEGGGTVVNGVYSAPMVSEPTRRTLTVASEADPAAFTKVYVLILPAGDIRIEAGGKSTAPADGTYKYLSTGSGYGPDADGKMWWFDDGMYQGFNYRHDVWWSPSGPPFPKDFAAWPILASGRGWGADGAYRLTVPPGRYRVRAYFSKVSAPSPGVAQSGWLDVNGVLSGLVDMSAVPAFEFRKVEMAASVGGDGTLQIAVRIRRLDDTSKTFSAPVLSGLEIIPDSMDEIFALIFGY